MPILYKTIKRQAHREVTGARKTQSHYPLINKTKNVWRYTFYYQVEKGVGDLFYTQIETDKGYQYAESAAIGRASLDACKFVYYISKKKVI